MTGNYSTREYREKLYDDLHVRLRDTVILMCAIFIASIGLKLIISLNQIYQFVYLSLMEIMSYLHFDYWKKTARSGASMNKENK